MLPFYKLFSLIVRVFARPLVNYTRRYHISNQSAEGGILKLFFIRFGNFYHRIEMSINRRFLKMQSAFTFKPLNDELALQKGIEIFYEIMIYGILIGFSVFEMIISSRDSAIKKKELDERLSKYQSNLTLLKQNVDELQEVYSKKIQQQKQKIEELEKIKPEAELKQSMDTGRKGYLHEIELANRKLSLGYAGHPKSLLF